MAPRRPVHGVTNEQRDAIREQAFAHLYAATNAATESMQINGISFVMMGIGIWLEELAELDPKATSRMLAHLSVIFDPQAGHTKKLHAERKRGNAARQIFAAADLSMTETAGSA